jgi:hypothetical protein
VIALATAGAASASKRDEVRRLPLQLMDRRSRARFTQNG